MRSLAAAMSCVALVGCGDLRLGLEPPLAPLDLGPAVEPDAGPPLDGSVDGPNGEAGHDADRTEDAGVRFDALYETVIRGNCRCHIEPPLLGGLNMSSLDQAYSSLLGMPPGSSRATSTGCITTMRPRVVPGNPAASLLWQKVQDYDDRLRCGPRMPRDAAPLSAADLALLTQWIADGALAP